MYYIIRYLWYRNYLDYEKISYCIYCFMWFFWFFFVWIEFYQRQYFFFSMDDWKMGYCGYFGSIGWEFYEGIWILRMFLGIGELSYLL